MKYTYSEILEDNQLVGILRSDGASIPLDAGNTDYQHYLRWLENPEAEENGTIS